MLSILTVIKLPAPGLEDTLLSVDREFGGQDNIEHLLKLHGPEPTPTPLPLSHIPYPVSCIQPRSGAYPVSARSAHTQTDQNVFDGMNQAVNLAKGDWILFLNAGDQIAAGFGPKLLQALDNADDLDFLYADGVTVDAADGRQFLREAPDRLTPEHFLARAAVLHPSLIVRKSQLLEHPFQLNLDLAADYEFMLWLLHSGKRGRRIPAVGSLVLSGGLSHRHRLRARRQALTALLRYAPSPAFKLKALTLYTKQTLTHLILTHLIPKQGPLRTRLRKHTGAHPPDTWL